MSREKERMQRQEEGAYVAARRDNRRCGWCGAVIPYGYARGPHGECPACVGALR